MMVKKTKSSGEMFRILFQSLLAELSKPRRSRKQKDKLILDALQGRTLRGREIAEVTGLSVNCVFPYVHSLCRRGLVKNYWNIGQDPRVSYYSIDDPLLRFEVCVEQELIREGNKAPVGFISQRTGLPNKEE